MRVAIVAIVLLVLAAFALAHAPSKKENIKPLRSRKPRSLSPKQVKILSDLFGKIGKRIAGVVRRVAPIAKKGFEIYKTVKSAGILSEHAVAPKSQKPRSRRPRSAKPASTKPRSRRPASSKPRSRKPRSLSPKQVKILSDLFGKIGQRIAGVVRRVAPIAKKGFEIYKTVKSTGILADRVAPKSQKPRSAKPSSRKPKSSKPASRKPKSSKPKSQKPKSRKPASRKPKSASRKPMAQNMREKIRAFIAKMKSEKPEIVKPIKEKIAVLKEKIRAAIKKRLDTLKTKKVASSKPKSSKPASRKPASRKPKSSKPKSQKPKKAAALADEKFFATLKNWWNNKGKDLFNKAKQIYEVSKTPKQE